jgi:tripartite-type tricarboxylate transporter receptor subunit TctC
MWKRSVALVAAQFLLLPTVALSATCPAGFPGSKPVRLVVGYAAGGGTDVIARAWANGFQKIHGWTVVVENRPGAGSGVLMAWLKNQPADGYILGAMGTDAVTINPAQGNVGYTWDNFEYLGSGMQTWTGIVAVADKPFNDLKEFVEFARKQGRATVSVAGVNQEVLVAQLAEEFKVNLVAIPGTGAAEAMTSALGGHVDATTQGTLHVAQIKAGKMKLIVSPINRRQPYAQHIGTLSEQGSKARTIDSHSHLVAPKTLPAEIKKCVSEALDEVVKSAEYKVVMDKFDNEPLNLGEQGSIDLISRSAAFYKEALAKKK